LRQLGGRVRLPALALLALACGDPKSPTELLVVPGARTVSVSDFTFTPSELRIRAGERVTWRNAGGFHNVEADDGGFRCAEGCDHDGGDGAPSSSAWTFSLTFLQPGTVSYFCAVHGAPGGLGMSGRIIVEAAR
jgi:plastocyanin